MQTVVNVNLYAGFTKLMGQIWHDFNSSDSGVTGLSLWRFWLRPDSHPKSICLTGCFFFRWLHAWIQANSSLSTFQSYANELRIPPSPWIEITNAIGRMTFSAKLEPTNSCKIELKKLADLEQKWFQDQSSMCSGARAHTEKKNGKGFASYIYTHIYIYHKFQYMVYPILAGLIQDRCALQYIFLLTVTGNCISLRPLWPTCKEAGKVCCCSSWAFHP